MQTVFKSFIAKQDFYNMINHEIIYNNNNKNTLCSDRYVEML